MRSAFRSFILALAFVALAAAGVAPAQAASCVDPFGVEAVMVELMPSPVPGSGLTAAQAELMRREHVQISESVADQLGIDSVGADVFGPNPQVRVFLDVPNPIDGRMSFAAYTVTGIFESPTTRIRVFRRAAGAVNGSDGLRNSGEYKLFAVGAGTSTPAVNPATGALTGVEARVLVTPVSSSTVTGGTSNPGTFYCEPNAGLRLLERTTLTAGANVALLVPHGGNIELRTSDQIAPLRNRLTTHGINSSFWEIDGAWANGSDQTFVRMHITAPALHQDSFPGLRQMLAKTDFANGIPFRFAVALHGFTSTQKAIVVGGRADREAKCLLVERIQDELETARGNRNEIGFRIVDTEGDVTVPNSGGHVPAGGGLGGQEGNNIVNRLSPNAGSVPGWGGIQLEQSGAVRTDTTNPLGLMPAADGFLRNVVARGVANALDELLAFAADAGPTDICEDL
jgi:phage replication-related protein YjqB (UPF0714/DUF867 family)